MSDSSRMSSQVFDQVIKKTRRGEPILTLARKVLVDGEPLKRVARDAGVQHQQLTEVTRQLRTLALDARPSSWVTLCVTVPKPIAREVIRLEKQSIKDLLKNTPEDK